MSLDSNMESFLRFLSLTEGLSQNTVLAYKRDLSLFQDWYLAENKTVMSLSQRDIEDL